LEDKEVRRAFDGRSGKRKRKADNYDVVAADDSDSCEDEEMSMLAGDVQEKDSNREVTASNDMAGGPLVVMTQSSVGSALQRNADGSVIAPKIKTRVKGAKVTFPLSHLHTS
jgi:ATP-dependent RNA helicase DHX37/DHR1